MFINSCHVRTLLRFSTAILLLTSHLYKIENRLYFKKLFCGDGGCGRGDFEGKVVKLEVPCTDVGADGEIV